MPDNKTLKERIAEAEGRSSLTDPIYRAFRTDGEKLEDTKVVAAGATPGPQRLTFTVPCPDEYTRLHLGQLGENLPKGIYGESEKHIHFDTENQDTKTIVSLGENPKAFAIADQEGLGSVPGALQGYTMGTEGQAYHYAKGSTTITSKDKDVVMNSAVSNTFFQSARSIAHVKAGKDIVFRAHTAMLGSGGLVPKPPTYTAPYETKSAELLGDISISTAVGWGDVAESVGQLIPQLTTPIPEGKVRFTGWDSTPERAEFVVSLAKIGASIVSLLFDLETAALVANGSVGMSAVAVGMSGTLTAGVGSNFAAGMASAVSSVVGGGYAALFGGLEACVQSANTTKVYSKTGKVSMAARMNASVNGGKSVQVAGNDHVQLNSDTAATVSGEAGVFFGAVDKFGFVATPSAVAIGDLGHGGDFNAGIDDGKPHLKIEDNKLTAKAHGRLIEIGDSSQVVQFDDTNRYAWDGGHAYKGKKIDLN